MTLSRQLVVGLLATTLCAASFAKVFGSAVRPGNFLFSDPSAVLPLTTSPGSTGLPITVTKAGIYLLTYSAECSVDAAVGALTPYLDLDIIVNGVAVEPTSGNQDAFCSSNGSGGHGQYLRASITVPVTLVAGLNSIRILARLNGAVEGWIGDSSLVIHQ